MKRKRSEKGRVLAIFGGVLANSPKVEFLSEELKLEGTNLKKLILDHRSVWITIGGRTHGHLVNSEGQFNFSTSLHQIGNKRVKVSALTMVYMNMHLIIGFNCY